MSVGAQASKASLDQSLTNLAIQLRNTETLITQFYQFVSTSGGVTFLEGLGYTAADAQQAMTLLGYMNTSAAVYFGTGTQATASNFDAALSVLWAGQ